MSWLTTPQRFFRPSKIRFFFFMVSILAYLITELGRFVYRPYARTHEIQDLGFADSIGNLGGIIVQIFFGLAILNPTRLQSYRLAVFFSVGYIMYEFAQLFLPKGVFDWKDVYGTVLGLGLSLLILLVLWRVFPELGDSPGNV